ncbi:MAG: metal ABC transporter ATP-binding protein [Clostridia bacterium]|nr:metal ABC transporter ATP-binding protein [Clostridia bacterium]
MSLLTINDLSLGYESHAILEHLSFSVNAGDYLCVVGENGSGKSTLMRTVLGLQKPLGGSIEFGSGMQRNEIGYLPQQTAIQKDFPATVWEIVLSGCQARIGRRAFYTKAEKALAEENLSRMGMADYRKRCYRELSGGQQQRVLLARALCATRKLLLLDEPVSGLDPKVTAEMYALIERLNREGVTIIMISHDIAAAIRYATHILHVGGGQTFFGSVDEY